MSIKVKDADGSDKYYGTTGDGGSTGDPFYGLVGDYYGEMALGNVQDRSISTKFGKNSDVDVGTPEDVWEGGGTYTGFPESFTPETVTVVSTDTDDTSAGTGARTIRITGLATSTSESYTTEDLTMNGTTNVTSVGTWWRVNRIQVLTAGSSGINEGTITCNSTTTTANVFGAVQPLYGQSTIGAFTVPNNTTCLIKRVRASITRANGSAGSASMALQIREPSGAWQSKIVFELGTDSPTEFTMLGGIVAPEGSDIKARVLSVSDANTICEIAMEYVFIDD